MPEAPVTAYVQNPDGTKTPVRSIHYGTTPEVKQPEDLQSKAAKKTNPPKTPES